MSNAPPVRALLIPADEARSCTVQVLPLGSIAFSDAIGGGLLEDAAYGVLGTDAVAIEPSALDLTVHRGYCVYLDHDRGNKQLPLNIRAVVLCAELGWPDDHPVLLRGDALVTGAVGLNGNDDDVPDGVIQAAHRGGIL